MPDHSAVLSNDKLIDETRGSRYKRTEGDAWGRGGPIHRRGWIEENDMGSDDEVRRKRDGLGESRKKFCKLAQNKPVRRYLCLSLGIGFFVAAMELLVVIVSRNDPITALHAVVLLVISVGVLVTFRREWAIALVAFGIVSELYPLTVFGAAAGIAILISGGGAVAYTMLLERAWQRHLSETEQQDSVAIEK